MILAAPPAPPLAFLGGSGINALMEFTDAELQEIARSVRGSARLRREDAKAQAGSSVAGIAAADADRLEQIAAKCERLRARAAPDKCRAAKAQRRSRLQQERGDRRGYLLRTDVLRVRRAAGLLTERNSRGGGSSRLVVSSI
jgi:hypothetical protein